MTVLMLSAFLGVSAMLLFSTTQLDVMISGNKYRHTKAAFAATSGINHFMALNIPARSLSRSLREQSEHSRVILRHVSLNGRTTFYTVSARVCCNQLGGHLPEDTLIIDSVGSYMKGRRVIAQHKISATVVDLSANNHD